jgi:hypothetical protein
MTFLHRKGVAVEEGGARRSSLAPSKAKTCRAIATTPPALLEEGAVNTLNLAAVVGAPPAADRTPQGSRRGRTTGPPVHDVTTPNGRVLGRTRRRRGAVEPTAPLHRLVALGRRHRRHQGAQTHRCRRHRGTFPLTAPAPNSIAVVVAAAAVPPTGRRGETAQADRGPLAILDPPRLRRPHRRLGVDRGRDREHFVSPGLG